MTDSADTTSHKNVFVISPIGQVGSDLHRKHLKTLKYVIKKALPEDQFDVLRADDDTSPDSITGAVIRRIYEADLIVADLSGHNPNVFYELAVAHGYGKPTIHIIEDGQSMPFDIADQRAIFYNLQDPASVDAAIASIAGSAAYLEGKPDGYQNPLTSISRFQVISEGSSADDAGEQVALALEMLGDRLARIERSLRPTPPSLEDAYRTVTPEFEKMLVRALFDLEQLNALLASTSLSDEERTVNLRRRQFVRRKLSGMGVDVDTIDKQKVGGLTFQLNGAEAAG